MTIFEYKMGNYDDDLKCIRLEGFEEKPKSYKSERRIIKKDNIGKMISYYGMAMSVYLLEENEKEAKKIFTNHIEKLKQSAIEKVELRERQLRAVQE